MEAVVLLVPALALSVAGVLGLTCLYLHVPRCPECSSLRATKDAFNGNIRICRDCHTIYRVGAG